MEEIKVDWAKWNRIQRIEGVLRLACFFGAHKWAVDTMSLEAYAQQFHYCKRCGVMRFFERVS